MTMLTKLKYVGVNQEDLMNIYVFYIRSMLEYCSVVWHSTLTLEQSNKLEGVQKLCLKVILGSEYENYEQALKVSSLDSLSDRRDQKCLNFGLKSLLHPVPSQMFPVNPQVFSKPSHESTNKEHFIVNWAKSESYKTSAIPYIQRMLNEYVIGQQ